MVEVWSKYDQAAVEELLLDERHGVQEDPEWLRGLKRATGNERLMVYVHQDHGTGVLGAWVYSPEEVQRPIVTELETFGLGGFSKGFVGGRWQGCVGNPEDLLPKQVLLARLQPVHEDDYRRRAQRLEAAKREQQKMREDMKAERDSTTSWMRKQRGLETAADQIDRGAVPWWKTS